MKSNEDLKRLIEQRGVRRHERHAILRTLVEEDASETLRARIDAALDNVRAQARKLRKALE
jgi:hypothetical protein